MKQHEELIKFQCRWSCYWLDHPKKCLISTNLEANVDKCKNYQVKLKRWNK
jgi:hypothetical protein